MSDPRQTTVISLHLLVPLPCDDALEWRDGLLSALAGLGAEPVAIDNAGTSVHMRAPREIPAGAGPARERAAAAAALVGLAVDLENLAQPGPGGADVRYCARVARERASRLAPGPAAPQQAPAVDLAGLANRIDALSRETAAYLEQARRAVLLDRAAGEQGGGM
jgi:hypothetical protein